MPRGLSTRGFAQGARAGAPRRNDTPQRRAATIEITCDDRGKLIGDTEVGFAFAQFEPGPALTAEGIGTSCKPVTADGKVPRQLRSAGDLPLTVERQDPGGPNSRRVPPRRPGATRRRGRSRAGVC